MLSGARTRACRVDTRVDARCRSTQPARAVLVLFLALRAAAKVTAALEAFIQQQMAGNHLPALSIALVDHERIVWQHAFGAATDNTVYRIGRLSSLFTEMAVTQLAERAELDLDAPVTRYLPDFHPRNPFGKPITLRQLLSQRAGLVREPPVGNYFDPAAPSLAATVRSLNDTELVYAPGTHTKESNAAIAVAGYVIERVKQQPFAQYMKQSLLEPLGMHASGFEITPEIRARLPKALQWTAGGREVEAPTFQPGIAPAVGMYSTVGDLARFLSRHRPQSHLQEGTIYGFTTAILASPDNKLSVVVSATKASAHEVVSQIAREALQLRRTEPIKPEYARRATPIPTRATPIPSRDRKGADLLGEYGWDHNELYILERDGHLNALLDWHEYYPLKQLAPNVFQFPPRGLYDGEKITFTATTATLGAVVFPRRPVGPGTDGIYRIEPLRPVAELRRESLALQPPQEKGSFRQSDLVELTALDPSIRLDIRYATANNFLGTPVYPKVKAMMQRPAAEAVARANRKLHAQGYGLLIHDAYRPWYVTKIFWEATPEDKRIFVADPSQGSRHNRGCAVDLTMFDLKTGKAVEMTGAYDEMSERSFPDYPGGTTLARAHRETLRRAMENEGFTVFEFEWWHFDYSIWREYPILNQDF